MKITLPVTRIPETDPRMSDPSKLNILIIGSGGREHALVRKCLESPLAKRVIAAPGNGGIAAEVECFNICVENIPDLVKLARKEQIGLVVVGPEIPLSLGLVDALTQAGIPAYGPDQKGAQLESSKVFCKEFLKRHKIPTADYGTFTDVDAALAYLEEHPAPIVIKADGLAAGKGVIPAKTQEEAIAAVKEMLQGKRFGDSGRKIVIEETLYGEEISIHAICSGPDFICLPPGQDHKRVGEGDTGPNTGGMGAYTPISRITPGIRAEIEERIIRPTLAGLRAEGIHYRGTLYAGLMLTEKGVRLLEYNVRFGDPEIQILLPMIEDDLVPLLLASAKGEVLPPRLRFRDGAAIVVVLAADGYPGSYEKDRKITVPANLPPNASIIHAGTYRDTEGYFRTSGGRVLGVVGQAPNLRQASDLAYSICEQIHFEGQTFRRDIGHRELNR